MVDPHGGLVDVRFERVVGVRERRDGKVLRRRGHEQERGGKKDLTEHTGAALVLLGSRWRNGGMYGGEGACQSMWHG